MNHSTDQPQFIFLLPLSRRVWHAPRQWGMGVLCRGFRVTKQLGVPQRHICRLSIMSPAWLTEQMRLPCSGREASGLGSGKQGPPVAALLLPSRCQATFGEHPPNLSLACLLCGMVPKAGVEGSQEAPRTSAFSGCEIPSWGYDLRINE